MARLNAKRARTSRATVAAAARDIGPIEPGLAVFAVTEGAYSMLDAVEHVAQQLAPARLTAWTWCVAEHDVAALIEMHQDHAISAARIVVDASVASGSKRGDARGDADLLNDWRTEFGPASVRYARTHAKMVAVEGRGLRVVIRGSTNLNANPRWEQLDITEGGPEFEMVMRLADELVDVDPRDDHAVAVASKVGEWPDQMQARKMLGELKPWWT